MIHNLKPYPSYKDSCVPWLGEVPEHWSVIPLKKVSRRMQNGSTPPTETPEYYADDGVPWYGPSSLGQTIAIGQPVKYVSNFAIYDGKVRLINPPALAVSVIGNVGRSALMLDLGATNQQITCFELCTNIVVPEFIAYQFRLAETTLMSSSSSSTISILDTNLLRGTRIAFPKTVSEQSTIVRYLDYIDRRIRRYIRAKQKLIKLLEEQKQAIIHQAVTRGLDPNVKLKSSGVEWLGDVPEHWEMKPAKWYYFEVDERSSTGSEELLSVSHITGVTPRSEKNITMFMAESYVGYKLCRENDLVINTMWAWMAALGVARQTGIVSYSYGVYRPIHKEAFLPQYIALLLRTKPYVAEYICRSTGIHSSRLRLYPEQFLRIPIIRPPIVEQQAILNEIHGKTSELERAIHASNQEILLLREYRTRLVADIVTGKLDVREAVKNLPEEVEETETFDDSVAEDEHENDEMGDQAEELEEEGLA